MKIINEMGNYRPRPNIWARLLLIMRIYEYDLLVVVGLLLLDLCKLGLFNAKSSH